MAKSTKLPPRLRRLSRKEAERLGVKHSSKRYVNADLKRVTRSTKLYSQRQAVQRLKGMTKETFQRLRKAGLAPTRPTKRKTRYGIIYKNLRPIDVDHNNLESVIKNAKGHRVQIVAVDEHAPAEAAGSSVQEDGGRAFFSVSFEGADLEQRLNALYHGRSTLPGLERFGSKNPPTSVSIHITEKTR